MKHFYYIRHGESEDNINNIWGGHRDTKLTPKGLEQAATAAEQVRKEGLRFDLIISSPLTRARLTAKAIAEATGYPVNKIVYDDRFLERDLGELEGTKQSDTMQSWDDYKILDSFDSVEKLEHLQARMAEALDYIKSRPEDNVLVVAHAAIGRGIRRILAGKDFTTEYTEPFNQIPNATLIKFI